MNTCSNNLPVSVGNKVIKYFRVSIYFVYSVQSVVLYINFIIANITAIRLCYMTETLLFSLTCVEAIQGIASAMFVIPSSKYKC